MTKQNKVGIYDNTSTNQVSNKLSAQVTGIPSGFAVIDQFTGGWQKQQLTLLTSLSGLGKTSLMKMFAQSTIKNNIPTMIVNLESNASTLFSTMICTEAKIDLNQFRSGQATNEERTAFNTHRDLLKQYPLFVDDSNDISLPELKTKIMRLQAMCGIQLVCIDFIEYIEINKQAFGSRQAELSYISSKLKQLADELNVPILAIAHLKRSLALEKRAPCLADLEATKSADNVLFLHRPPEATQGMTELIIAKCKGKPTNVTIPLRFIGKYTYFESLENSEA